MPKILCPRCGEQNAIEQMGVRCRQCSLQLPVLTLDPPRAVAPGLPVQAPALEPELPHDTGQDSSNIDIALPSLRVVPVAQRNPTGEDNSQLTGAGCVLTFLSVAVIFGVAVPVVQRLGNLRLPSHILILTPVLIGATFHGIGTVLLRLVGVRVWSKSVTDESCPLEN